MSRLLAALFVAQSAFAGPTAFFVNGDDVSVAPAGFVSTERTAHAFRVEFAGYELSLQDARAFAPLAMAVDFEDGTTLVVLDPAAEAAGWTPINRVPHILDAELTPAVRDEPGLTGWVVDDSDDGSCLLGVAYDLELDRGWAFAL